MISGEMLDHLMDSETRLSNADLFAIEKDFGLMTLPPESLMIKLLKQARLANDMHERILEVCKQRVESLEKQADESEAASRSTSEIIEQRAIAYGAFLCYDDIKKIKMR
jgi:hypothetical protein